MKRRNINGPFPPRFPKRARSRMPMSGGKGRQRPSMERPRQLTSLFSVTSDHDSAPSASSSRIRLDDEGSSASSQLSSSSHALRIRGGAQSSVRRPSLTPLTEPSYIDVVQPPPDVLGGEAGSTRSDDVASKSFYSTRAVPSTEPAFLAKLARTTKVKAPRKADPLTLFREPPPWGLFLCPRSPKPAPPPHREVLAVVDRMSAHARHSVAHAHEKLAHKRDSLFSMRAPDGFANKTPRRVPGEARNPFVRRFCGDNQIESRASLVEREEGPALLPLTPLVAPKPVKGISALPVPILPLSSSAKRKSTGGLVGRKAKRPTLDSSLATSMKCEASGIGFRPVSSSATLRKNETARETQEEAPKEAESRRSSSAGFVAKTPTPKSSSKKSFAKTATSTKGSLDASLDNWLGSCNAS